VLPHHILKRHPIPMRAHFTHSLVLAWALPAATLEQLVPAGLTLDTYDGLGFVAVALVQTRDLRPVGLPAAVGGDHVLTGYRLFVRRRDADGRLLRGLHILRSDADRRRMVVGGNLLTHYRYRKASIDLAVEGERLRVRIDTPGAEADLRVTADLGSGPAPLPEGSPFASARDARRFAGPLRWTFDHEPETDSIVMIRGRRSQWDPRPVAVEVDRCTFLDHEPFADARPRLANAFHVTGVDYRWDRGVRVPTGGATP
jgi:hypothetical protein